MDNIILHMQQITKVFPGVKALDRVDMEVRAGEIHAVCGENGAGKSTLMNILSGIYPYGSYEGEVIYQGKPCRFRTIKDSEREGIVIIHQELALVPYLSVAENMFLGNEQQTGQVIDWDRTYREAAEHMAVVGLQENPRALIKDIGVGKQQLVEIAKALAKEVKLLILDEPTSALNEADARKLLDLLIRLKEDKGVTSILISHKLNELAYCADRITVIRDGRSIETLIKGVDEISEERIIKGMVGREMTSRYPVRKRVPGDMALELKDWTVYHPLYADRVVVDGVSLNVRKGEVVGISGLIGAGRTELAMSIFGKAYGTRISGEMRLYGQVVDLSSIAKAIDAGLAYVTEDRKGNGLITSDSVKHNMTLARPQLISHRGVLDMDLETHRTARLSRELGIRTPSVEQLVGNLSGGNQQKVLVAKWIFAQRDILILDEPTRGVDVGAKYEIYQIINGLVEDGKAVLMISSDLPEILGMCDRIYTMNEGRLIAEFSAQEATQEKIMGSIMQNSRREIGA